MIRKLSYRYLLVAMGVILALLLLGSFQLKDACMETYKSYALLKDQIDLIDHAPEILLRQSQELKRLSGASKAFDNGAENLDLNSSIDFGIYLENTCKKYKVRMISLPREKKEVIGGYKTLEENFSLEGTHKNLLSFLYDLEQGVRVGSITRLAFKKEDLRVRGSKKKVLTLEVSLKRLIEI